MNHSLLAYEIRDASFSYNGVQALSTVSLAIKPGERIALIGANGSGKSTLLRLLAGLSFPASGVVSFRSEPLTKARLDEEEFFLRFRRRVGVVFQNPDVQLFNASVFDEVAFGPLQLGWPKDRIRDQVEQTLHDLRIENLRNRAPHRLSGGEKKRVAIASVLVLDPEVLLLDEPTAALDPQTQNQIVDLLAGWRGSGKTVITATHDLDTLEDIAERCYVMKSGQIAFEDSTVSVLHNLNVLKDARLIRPQHHVHQKNIPHPHPHVHEIEPE